MVGKLENTTHSTLTQHGGLIMVQRCSLQIVNKMTIIKWVLCIRKYSAKLYGNVKPPVPAVTSVGAAGGLMATHNKDNVMVISPDQTNTIVGVFPLLPIRPFGDGYWCANTQKLKNAPQMNLLH